MTLAEAIENQKELRNSNCPYFTIHDYASFTIAIGAMEKLELDRQTSIHHFEPLLPGEKKTPLYLF